MNAKTEHHKYAAEAVKETYQEGAPLIWWAFALSVATAVLVTVVETVSFGAGESARYLLGTVWSFILLFAVLAGILLGYIGVDFWRNLSYYRRQS